MPYYHATTADRLPSILQHGLGGIDTGPRSEVCERGVYLAAHPALALAIALEHILNEGAEVHPSPAAAVEAVRVIVVDDARLDADRLRADPHVTEWRGSWLYDGVVDVGGLSILTTQEARAGSEALDPSACGWVEESPSHARTA